MKNMLKFLAAALFAVAVVSCDSTTVGPKSAAIGAPYELLVLCDNANWEGPLGDTLRTILQQPVVGLSQPEPIYNVLRVMPDQFSGMLRKNRNILNVAISDEHVRTIMGVQYDVYAVPQMIVTLSGPSAEEVTAYVSDHRGELTQVFEMAERDRDVNNARRYGDNKIPESIKEKFGFDVNVLKGYKIGMEGSDFMWVLTEYPNAYQSMFIYSYPYRGAEGLSLDFSLDSLIAVRNRFMANVTADNEGSYMTTFEEYRPDLSFVRVNGRLWSEMRGFWDMKGDFMGGPFVNYTTVDEQNGRMVAIDFFVYSPEKPKRNYMRALEHMLFSVSFPGDEQPQETETEE